MFVISVFFFFWPWVVPLRETRRQVADTLCINRYALRSCQAGRKNRKEKKWKEVMTGMKLGGGCCVLSADLISHVPLIINYHMAILQPPQVPRGYTALLMKHIKLRLIGAFIIL